MKHFAPRFLLGLRIVIFGFFILITTAFLILSAKETLAANLKDISIVTDNTLKLADVFEGLEQNGDYVLGPAPKPGEDMVLNARTLYRIAVALELPWRPGHAAEQIIIRRAATVVPFQSVRDNIMDAVIDEGVNNDFTLELYSQEEDIILPHGMKGNVEIESFSLDFESDLFEAVMAAPSVANPIVRLPVSGKIERLVQVPVLRSTLRNGDLIGENDIDWIKIEARKVQRDLIMKSAQLVGMTPRRALMAGKPVLDGELERPQVVNRGEAITILYNNGGMRLSAKGKALQDGAMGDTIRIANTNSSKIIQGTVTNMNEVSVQ